MKPMPCILLLVFTLMAACNSNKQVPEPVEGPSKELSAIDTLMWQQPDSALAVLMDYLDDNGRDAARHVSTNETFDNHYAHLLLAELSYKNDYAQTNRAELRQAVDFFDNLTHTINGHPHASWRHCGLDPQSPELNDNLIFLDARAHYINGVSYYEHDSVVEACEEYLKALEVMESHFADNELMGTKAKFMSYTYNRLGDLLSEHFMVEPTIDCYEKSLEFNLIKTTSPYGIANTYYHLGIQFDVLGQKEKASDYYVQALQSLPDTNNCLYRDIVASMTLLDYQMSRDTKKSLEALRWLIIQAKDDAEKRIRFLVVGTLYYEERQYDSALLYLEQVYENNENAAVQIQVADYLLNIYQSMGDESKAKECANYLSQIAVSELEQKAVQSQLTTLFQDYLQKKAENQTLIEKMKHQRKYVLLSVMLMLLFVTATVFVSGKLRKKKLKSAELRHDAELNDLRGINHHLQEENQKLAKKNKHAKAPLQEYDALLRESICSDLLQRFGRTEILTTNKPGAYAALAITPREKQTLAKMVMKHCPDYDMILKMHYPTIKTTDLEVCRFLLIGLSEQQIAVLLQKDYSTIWKRVKRLREMMGFVEPKIHLTRLLFETEAKQ